MLTHPTLDKLQSPEIRWACIRPPGADTRCPRSLSYFEERLGLLVDRELTARENRRLTTVCTRRSSGKRPVSKISTIAIHAGWINR